MQQRHHTTLLDLVSRVQDLTSTDREAVIVISEMINSGRVVLEGTFRGTRLVVV